MHSQTQDSITVTHEDAHPTKIFSDLVTISLGLIINVYKFADSLEKGNKALH